MKDFYYILGTDSRCTPDELNEAYRKLSLKLAPTLGEDDFFLRSHFNEISEAYEILSDPVKRKHYDDAVKRNHRKQLAGFKTSSLGLATVGALVLFTSLFGFYVFRTLSNNGKATPTTVAVAVPDIAAAPANTKHHKKKHHTKTIAKSRPAISVKKDTVKQAVGIKPLAVVANLPTVSATKNQAVVTVPVAAVVIKPAPSVTQPRQVVARTYAPADSLYVTYIKPMSEQIYLHQQADYMSTVVTVLPSRSKVKILAKGTTFYKIAYNEQVGYVPKWAIVKP